jgi:hypothetical protein
MDSGDSGFTKPDLKDNRGIQPVAVGPVKILVEVTVNQLEVFRPLLRRNTPSPNSPIDTGSVTTSRNSGSDPLFYPGVATLIPDHDNREIIQVAE